jgi:hypothetical protein
MNRINIDRESLWSILADDYGGQYPIKAQAIVIRMMRKNMHQFLYTFLQVPGNIAQASPPNPGIALTLWAGIVGPQNCYARSIGYTQSLINDGRPT